MAIFGMGKGREGQQPMTQAQEQAPPQIPSSATEEVIRLRQKGLTNSQIIETLQKNGYKTHQIFDALNQAEIGRPASQIPGAPFFDEAPTLPMQNMQTTQAPEFPQETQMDSYEQPTMDDKMEELAEAIIEEKWNELLKDINKIIEWKSTMEANMKALEQRQQDLKQSFDSLQKALISKVNDYDQNITNVGTELKALEKVFQKLLPTFTENVNELSRTVKELKKK